MQYAYVENDPINFTDPQGLFLYGADSGGNSGSGGAAPTIDPSLLRFVFHFSPTPGTAPQRPLTPGQIYDIAYKLKQRVKARKESDCEALADFADAMADSMGDGSVRGFVNAFGVLTPKRPGE